MSGQVWDTPADGIARGIGSLADGIARGIESSPDPLDGFRARPLDEDEQALLDAIRGADVNLDTRRQIQIAQAAQSFLVTPLGQYIERRVNEAEQNFLQAARNAGHVDESQYRLAHFDYLVAMQMLLWLGEAVAEGQEAMADYESTVEGEMPHVDLSEEPEGGFE